MKRFIIVAAAVLSSAATVSPAQQVAATKFQVSGIPVILKPVTANDVIAVRLYIRGGSSNLSPSNAGIESFMLETATHGTAKYSKDAFNELLRRRARAFLPTRATTTRRWRCREYVSTGTRRGTCLRKRR